MKVCIDIYVVEDSEWWIDREFRDFLIICYAN